MAEMWQPQCSTVGDGGGDRQADDRAGVFGHESVESRFSPIAMLQSQTSRYSLPASHLSQEQQQQQQHLVSLYEQQLQQRYQQHYQLQQQQLQATGYGHHSSAGQTTTSPVPPQQPQSSAAISAASRTTKIPDDQVAQYTLVSNSAT